MLTALLFACSATPSAARGMSLETVGIAQEPAYADGRHHAAWQQADGRVMVLDTRSGAIRTFRPPSCTDDPEVGALAGVSFGRLLWACHQGLIRAFPLVQRFSDPSAQPVPGISEGWNAGSSAFEITFTAIGREWIVATERGDGGRTRPVFIGRDGEIRRSSRENRRWITDLDRPGLRTRMCATMQRPVSRPEPLFPATLLPFAYHRPYGLAVVLPTRDPLRLQRCGRPPRRLSRCLPECSTPSLSRSMAAWSEDDRVVVQRLASGGRYRSTVLSELPGKLSAMARSVVASFSDPDVEGWRIVVGRLR